MAAGGDRSLSNYAIEELSEKISVKEMISIAIKYFGVDFEVIDNLKTKHREDITWISRDLLLSWRRHNPSDNQVKVGDIFFDVIQFLKSLNVQKLSKGGKDINKDYCSFAMIKALVTAIVQIVQSSKLIRRT